MAENHQQSWVEKIGDLPWHMETGHMAEGFRRGVEIGYMASFPSDAAIPDALREAAQKGIVSPQTLRYGKAVFFACAPELVSHLDAQRERRTETKADSARSA